MPLDPQLADFAAGERQREYVLAVVEHGSNNKAAKALGVGRRVVDKAIERVKFMAAQRGYSPDHGMTRPVAPGFKPARISTNYRDDGSIGQQWVIQTPDAQQQEAALREFVSELMEDVKGKAPTVKPPTMTNADLLAVYPIGDHHHGMYADGDETGGRDYDCKISAHALETAVDYLATLAPPAEDALLINLGDYLHANDSTNETPGHHNRLDVDTRYGRVMHSGALALVHSILRLLRKHQRVFVWNMRGNHDPDAAFALALAISFYFHNEPRVIVDLGASLYKYHRFGQNLLGAHHGHGAKAAELPLIMATDRKQDWGETSFRVWHCGHIHHKTAKEFPGCVVETHRTLPPQDAWAAGKGYRAESDMNAIIYHREYGEIQRSRFDLAMVK